jgi:hypothetical protein
MKWNLTDVVSLLSIANIPNIFIPFFFQLLMKTHKTRILITLKFLSTTSWLLMYISFRGDKFYLLALARVFQVASVAGSITITTYTVDLLLRPFGKRTFLYALRPIIDSLFISVSFKLIPILYVHFDGDLGQMSQVMG